MTPRMSAGQQGQEWVTDLNLGLGSLKVAVQPELFLTHGYVCEGLRLCG